MPLLLKGQEGFDLNEGWLFDNQSTDDIACSEDVVIPGSIRRVFHHLHLETNAGTLVVEHKCRIKGYPRELWFSDKGLANILSFLKYVRKCHPQLKISYEVKASTFIIYRQNSNLPDMVFSILECGLHCHHPSSDGMVLVNTVANKKKCLPRERLKVQSADLRTHTGSNRTHTGLNQITHVHTHAVPCNACTHRVPRFKSPLEGSFIEASKA